MKEIFRLCLVLTLICAVSAGLLAFVNEKTAEPIAKAALEEKMSAVRSVLPSFDNEPDKDVVEIADAKGTNIQIYRGRKNGEIVGVAFEVVAPDGYSGEIRFIVGVNPDGIVQGIEILKHLETPGLGSKIVEADFRDQYRNKSLSDPATWAVTKDGGTFEPITGATISSRAVTKALSEGLKFYSANRGRILGAEKEEAAGGVSGEDADSAAAGGSAIQDSREGGGE